MSRFLFYSLFSLLFSSFSFGSPLADVVTKFSLGSSLADNVTEEDDGLPSWLDSLKQVILTQDTRRCGIFAQRSGAHNVLACMQYDSLYVLYYLGADVETAWNCGDVKAVLLDTVRANAYNAQWFHEDKSTTTNVVVNFTDYGGFHVDGPNHHTDNFVKLFPKHKYHPMPSSATDPSSDICADPDTYPEYPGGNKALYSFVANHLTYPVNARFNGVQGRVFVGFVVDTDGSVTDVKVEKPIHPALDAEAVRLVKLMPKWQPATKGGRPVKVSVHLPINFSIKTKFP